MSDRRKMHIGDWLNGAAILAVGLFLGLAIGEWINLEGAAFWLTIVYVFIPFGFVFLFIFFLDDLMDRSFFSSIKPPSSKKTEERKPLALLLSLPTGFMIGAIGAQFGLTEILLSNN